MPHRAKLRRLQTEPMCTKSSTASEEPRRPQLRSARELPRCTKSSTLQLLPKRPKDRSAKELPSLTCEGALRTRAGEGYAVRGRDCWHFTKSNQSQAQQDLSAL